MDYFASSATFRGLIAQSYELTVLVAIVVLGVKSKTNKTRRGAKTETCREKNPTVLKML